MKQTISGFLLTFLFLATTGSGSAQTTAKITCFHLNEVELLESPFKRAQDLDKQYLLDLEVDRLLAPFLREAGLPAKAESYTNWENSGLDGHIGGHYLSALSLMYASTYDTQIKARLEYMLSEMKRVQDANGNGYIGGVPGGKAMWSEIAQGAIRASGFGLNDKWVPLYNIHKTYAGLRDAYLYAGSELAKTMLVKMTDWMLEVTKDLSDEQMQDMLRSEHGGLNETFADVAALTGDEKYLKLAERFSHLLILNPLLEKEDKLTGMHANTQIPKVLGFKRIADLEGRDNWSEATRFFWETVVEHRSVSIGGNSANEHFHPADDFSRMITSVEGPETCNTYNMLRLTKMLYQTSGDKQYSDYYERALYNHILSSQHPHTGGLVYFTQMRPGHYRVYSQPQTSMWCCVGSGIENHAKYGEMIYAHTADELYVNLFIPSKLSWTDKKVEIIQRNDFPASPATELTINPSKTTAFTLKLRYPAWVDRGALRVSLNGKPIPAEPLPSGYISIDRKWKKGDKIRVEMPMRVVVEQLPDKSNYYSFLYGPIVLAAKTGTDDLKGLFADDSRGGHVAHGRQIALDEMPIVVAEPEKMSSLVEPVKDSPLTFRINSLFPEKYAGGLELIPFYMLHESRYVMYWPQATTEEVKQIQEQIKAEEAERQRLNEQTIDRVTCGEQQPESDHFIQLDDSWTGSMNGIAWRECRGFFSYELKNTEKQARQLYIAYFDRDQDVNRSLCVSVNGVEAIVGSEYGNKSPDRQTMRIAIPESEQNKETLVVRIAPMEANTITSRLVELRILK